MKNTFGFYIGGLGGSPSLRTFGIHHLIHEELLHGKNVKIYAIFLHKIKTTIRGLFKFYEVEICMSIHEIENKCVKEYKEIYGRYPDWNFQENNLEWPKKIKNLYIDQVNNRKVKK